MAKVQNRTAGRGSTGTELAEQDSTGTELATQGPTGTELAAGTDSSLTGGFLEIGEIIGDGWEIKSKLNVSSGEAEVYHAQKDGEKGIVKYYRKAVNDETCKRQTDILEKIQGLHHPDIINLYEFGRYKGRLFEIMEYAAGGGLDSRNEDGKYKYLPLPEKEVFDVCEEVINAFRDCHKLGIIHRDIKPANLYYRTCSETPDKKGKYTGNDVIIADFGISSVTDESEKYHKTRTTSRTSNYAAPEIQTKEINYKYDYYALGVTLWELATGNAPFVDANGRQQDSILVMQISTRGEAADNLLRTKPHLSEKLQRLIRGLLVVNPDHRWGFEEVTDHLAGKEVEIKAREKVFPKITIGEKTCTSFEELAKAIMEKPKAARKKVFEGPIEAALRPNYPDLADKIMQIAEKYSAENDYDNGTCKIAWTLSLEAPFMPGNGYEARGPGDIMFLIANAPETMLPLLRDKNSRLYIYLEVLDQMEQSDSAEKEEQYETIQEQAETIKAIAHACGDAELIAKAQLILNGRKTQPLKLKKYQEFILDTPENLLDLSKEKKIKEDLQNRILSLIAEENYEGLIYPWIDLHLKERGINRYAPTTWKELMDLFEKTA